MKVPVVHCGNPQCACSDYTPAREAEIAETMTDDQDTSPRD